MASLRPRWLPPPDGLDWPLENIFGSANRHCPSVVVSGSILRRYRGFGLSAFRARLRRPLPRRNSDSLKIRRPDGGGGEVSLGDREPANDPVSPPRCRLDANSSSAHFDQAPA